MLNQPTSKLPHTSTWLVALFPLS